MKRTGTVLVLSGCLWLAGAAVGQAYQDHDRISRTGSRKEVSFEVLRMLSTGMTKMEVLSRAGSPQHRFKNRGTQSWIYSASDHWLVEIVFSGNNVISIHWTRA
jgi:hypothetical protein